MRSLIADLGDAYSERLRRTGSGRSRSRRRTSAPRSRSPKRSAGSSASRVPPRCSRSPRCPTRAGARATSRSEPSTASTSATGGDRRRRHRAHLRAAPAQRHPPRGGAEADHAVRDQARRDRGPRRLGARRDPVRPRVLGDRGGGVLLADPDRDARRRGGCRSGRTSASGPGRAGTSRCFAGTTSSRPASSRWSRWTGRRSPRRGSGPRSPPATSSGRDALPRGAVPARGGGRRRGSSRPRARLPDREHRSPRRARLSRARRLRGVRERASGRRQRRRQPHLRDRPRGACRDLHHRRRRRALRPVAADRVHRQAARRAPVRGRRRRWSRRCARTSPGPAICVPPSDHPANLSASQ